MTETTEEQGIKSAIKLILKNRGLNYQDLATALKTSLPTVRRYLTSSELSLRTVIEITNWLDISLEDLLAQAKLKKLRINYLTEQAEKFFASHAHFYTYLRLLGAGYSPAEIEKQYKLNANSTQRYLTELEILDLVKVDKSKRTVLKISWPVNLRFPGEMQKKFSMKIFEYFLHHLNKRVLSTSRPGGGEADDFFFRFDSVRLRDSTYAEYVSELRALYQKYALLSRHELKSFSLAQLKCRNVLFGIDSLDAFSDVMGHPQNIR